MTVEFDKYFEKSLSQIRDKSIYAKVEKIILTLENKTSLTEISNIKKLVGYKNYYRIRLGDYRLGFEKINDTTILLIVITHRKDIYKVFP